jgi:hypothetical protein
MAKMLINQEDARVMHQDFYDKPFEIVQVNRSGAFDRFPWSLFYGASDINSWSGLISTDGEKVIVTKGGYFKDGQITQKWEFPASDIVSAEHGAFKTRLNFDKKVRGLTTKSFFEALLLLGVGMVTLWLPYFLYNSKKVNFRMNNEFGTKESFIKLLGK